MRVVRAVSAALLTLGLAAAPAAADASPSPSQDGSSGPTRAGTSFRTATEIEPGQEATAGGSTGDYLYWSVPVDTGQRPTVRATVKLPDTHASQTWQVDVYDGLRRRQACRYGAQTRTAAADAASVELACALRTVRAWSEPWANDPLPGTYYIRLTATGVATSDLGLPVDTRVRVESVDVGGAAAVDGSLAEPLVPGIATRPEEDREDAAVLAGLEPEDGWTSGWWSDRWVWTALGGALAALAGVAGYALTRGAGRPARVPPGA
ncbi:hypothetical protein [Streptomyces sp. enrichment culture]|uniref:hypothetical protein n=1 Tax=Streptomyces sp. enrichment culture TaxID=1795815 RepID=UPI003F5483E9